MSTPPAPQAPPPPPNPATLSTPSIIEQGAAERARLAGAEGSGLDGTVLTGGQGVQNVSTTKSLLGG